MKCSKCGKPIEFMGKFGGVFSPETSVQGAGNASDFEMWKAQVCTKCQLVFCGDCIELGRPTPCPECGNPTEPAYHGTLKAMGEPRTLTTGATMPRVKIGTISEGPFHFTDANFEETISKNSLVLVDFWAGWCGPCRALAPTIEELAKELAGKVFVGKLDVDENPATSEKFNVSSIPTVVILKDCCEVEKIIGLCNKQRYVDALKKHMT